MKTFHRFVTQGTTVIFYSHLFVVKESFPKLQASIHDDALIFLQFCCCNVKYLSGQIGALYVRLRFCDFFPFPAFPFSFEPFPSTELRCPQYHSVTEWGSRVWTTDQFSNPSLFILVKSFSVLSDFYSVARGR